MAAPSSSNRVWLSAYTLMYALLGIILLWTLWQSYDRSLFVEQPPRPQLVTGGSANPPVVGQIDPNIAPWHEMVMLPAIGKSVAQEIVTYRQQGRRNWKKDHPDSLVDDALPVFTKPEDLLPIKGIGPATLEKIRPYLQFPAQ